LKNAIRGRGISRARALAESLARPISQVLGFRSFTLADMLAATGFHGGGASRTSCVKGEACALSWPERRGRSRRRGIISAPDVSGATIPEHTLPKRYGDDCTAIS